MFSRSKKTAYIFLLICFLFAFTSGCTVNPVEHLIPDKVEASDEKISVVTVIPKKEEKEDPINRNEEPVPILEPGSGIGSNDIDIKEISENESEKSGFTFVVAGDNRPADDNLPQPQAFIDILGCIKDVDPLFFIITGDIINGRTDDEQVITRQFSDYLEAVRSLDCINFVSPGNHDVSNDISRKYFIKLILAPVIEQAAESEIKIYKGDETYTGDTGVDYNMVSSSLPDKGPDCLYYYFKMEDIYFI